MLTVLNAPTTLRASSYNIYVDLPDDRDHVLLVQTYSGAYDKVSRTIASYVRSLDLKPPKPLYGSWSDDEGTASISTPSDFDLEMLKRRGYLTTLTRQEERERFNRYVDILHKVSTERMPSYVFMPTYDCNLRCHYCFQDHMRTNPAYEHLLRSMTPNLIDRLFAALPQIEARHGANAADTPRSILFFGGEPLLLRNKSVIEYIMTRARSLSAVTFSAVSNATDLDAYANLLGPDGIATIQITLDGPPEEHDKRRIYADRSGSFEKIANNIDLALSLDVNIDVRMNIDRLNVATLPILADLFAARGWSTNKRFSAYVAPIHAANDNVEKQKTFNSYELKEALRALQGENDNMKVISIADDFMRDGLIKMFTGKGSPLTQMKTSFCGAHNKMYIFDPFGDIYACWERTGDKNIRIGWLDEDGSVQLVADRLAAWRSRTVTSNETCAQCRYSLYCGGGCAVLAEDVHGTIFGNFCDAFGKRFRTAVAEAYIKHLSGAIETTNSTVLEIRSL